MSKYIDADKLKRHYAWWDDETKKIFDEIIDLQPAAYVVLRTERRRRPSDELVRHGRWEELYENNYKCSVCGSWWTCEETPIESGMSYCPNCGAAMIEEEEA